MHAHLFSIMYHYTGTLYFVYKINYRVLEPLLKIEIGQKFKHGTKWHLGKLQAGFSPLFWPVLCSPPKTSTSSTSTSWHWLTSTATVPASLLNSWRRCQWLEATAVWQIVLCFPPSLSLSGGALFPMCGDTRSCDSTLDHTATTFNQRQIIKHTSLC